MGLPWNDQDVEHPDLLAQILRNQERRIQRLETAIIKLTRGLNSFLTDYAQFRPAEILLGKTKQEKINVSQQGSTKQ